MWTSKRKKNSVDTLIAEGTSIQGNITFEGALFIDGEVEGDVVCAPDKRSVLSIGLHGKIKGEIRAPYVIIFGGVEGDVHASEKVDLKPGSKVTGDLRYKVIEMNAGAAVNGKMIVIGETQALEHKPLPDEDGETAAEQNAEQA